MQRTSKIGHLPSAIRQTLNERLDQGEPSNLLVQWLNGQPSVLETLQKDFEGRLITKANLSDWKQTGFQHWKAEKVATAMFDKLSLTPAEKLTNLQGGLIDQMATLYAAQLLADMQKAGPADDDAARAKMWREFRLAFASLRRYQLATVLLQDRLRSHAGQSGLPESMALTEEEKRSQVEQLLGIAGGPDADRFDVKTQTWTGPNAEVMNRQHRKLLLQASREAGLDLDQSRQDLENDPESSPVAPNQGESWQK